MAKHFLQAVRRLKAGSPRACAVDHKDGLGSWSGRATGAVPQDRAQRPQRVFGGMTMWSPHSMQYMTDDADLTAIARYLRVPAGN